MALVAGITTTWAAGLPGRRANTDVSGVRTIALRSTTELTAGRVVIRGASDGLCALPSGSAGSVMGIALYNPAVDPRRRSDPTNDLLIPAADTPTNVLRRGTVYMIAEDAVTQGAPVYYRHTTPGAAPQALGAVRSDTDSGKATLLVGAVFASSAASGAVVAVEVNFP